MQAYGNAHGGARGVNPSADGREWVVLLTPDTRRMMSTAEVQAEVSAGTLARETLVWRAGMNEWIAISSIGELDVPVMRQNHWAPAPGWDAPPAQQRPVSHSPARAHGHHHPQEQRPTMIGPQVMQELITTGAVAAIMVAATLYMLSLGGAFASGGGHHGAPSGEASTSGATAQQSH